VRIVLLILAAVYCTGYSQWNNFRIYPSTVTQSEIVTATDPNNHDLLFVSANTINLQSFFLSEGIYVSTDRGDTWYGSDTANGNYISYHYGDPGVAIDKNGRFILTRLGRSPFLGLYSHYSTDKGINWSTQYTITTDDLDRASTASDGDISSNFYGRTYTVWVKFAPPYPVVFSYTDNGAETWSIQRNINTPLQRCEGGEVQIDKNGKVYACWAGVSSTSPFTENYVGFASSTNGGENWDVKENIFNMEGIKGLLPSKGNIRVNGLPKMAIDTTGSARDGWIYIVTTQKNLSPAGQDPDIILNISTDGGNTWQDGIRVNQDPLNNGRIQYFPAIHVDYTGAVNIIYYDDRLTTTDSAAVFLSRSTDGGINWKEYEISSHRFKPQPIGGLGQGYQGDNIAITSSGDRLLPFWMDNSTGIYQVWTSPINISLLSSEDDKIINPLSFQLMQNYPNPFNPSTSIKVNLPEYSYLSLKVYNIKGEEIEILNDGVKPAGAYEFNFDGREFSSGVYFCRMITEKHSSVIKMVSLK
jgi:hypothetical protein